MPIHLPQDASGRRRAGPKETVTLLAALMALNAFAIDAMIPALPDIGSELGVSEENRRQLVVVVYFFGFGIGQLFWGPLSDRYGRKPILAFGVALYAAFAMLCAVAASFELLIASRFAMGASAAVTRVLVTAMVRDLFEGEEMARIMSLVFMVFMAVPMLAPNIGQAILWFADWRAIFVVLAAYGTLVWVWSYAKLPETLRPEYRQPIDAATIWKSFRIAARDRLSAGYTIAMTAVFGALTAYISSIQQIVFDVFDAAELIGIIFASIAAPMVLASWGNSRVVGRFGLRRTGHAGLIAFVFASTLHILVAETIDEPLWLFVLLMQLSFVSFAFTTSNFGTLAMANMAPIAGTASSLQGVTGTIGGALIGLFIGQAFDGTQLPFLIGCAICGAIALLVVLWTEKGRLFAAIGRPREEEERVEARPPPEPDF